MTEVSLSHPHRPLVVPVLWFIFIMYNPISYKVIPKKELLRGLWVTHPSGLGFMGFRGLVRGLGFSGFGV